MGARVGLAENGGGFLENDSGCGHGITILREMSPMHSAPEHDYDWLVIGLWGSAAAFRLCRLAEEGLQRRHPGMAAGRFADNEGSAERLTQLRRSVWMAATGHEGHSSPQPRSRTVMILSGSGT